MPMNRFCLLSFFAMLLLSACRESTRDLRPYFFPLDELEQEGKVYIWMPVADSLQPPFVYYYKAERDSAGRLWFIRAYFDYQLQPFQINREKVVANGVKLVESRLFDRDTAGRLVEVPVEVEYGNVFPFEAGPRPGVLLTRMSWRLPFDTATTMTLVRNRQFAGDTTWTFGSRTYDAVRFAVRELIDNVREGHLEYEYPGEEIYARGLGMVWFRKEVDDELTIEYRLDDILPESWLWQQLGRTQILPR